MTRDEYKEALVSINQINGQLGNSTAYETDPKLWHAVSNLTDLVEMLIQDSYGHICDDEPIDNDVNRG